MVGLELDQSKGEDTGEDEVSGTLAVRKDEPPPSLSTPLCPLQGGTEAQMATSLAEGGCNSGLSVLSVADLAEELCPLHGTRTDPPPHPNPGEGRRSRRRERLERRRRWRDALARDARDGREGALASHVCAVSGKKNLSLSGQTFVATGALLPHAHQANSQLSAFGRERAHPPPHRYHP